MRKAFQEATVTWAVERLGDPQGSRRVLVADEVGLGKTLVAQGVVDALAKARSGDKPLRVFYLCSSLSIAHQNRDQLLRHLSQDQRAAALVQANRLSLLLERPQPSAQAPFHLYTLTPGTSLQAGTGILEERILLGRCVWNEFAFRADDWFHQAFQIGATKNWRSSWDASSVPSWFSGALRKRFVDELGRTFPRRDSWGLSLGERVRDALRDPQRSWSTVASLRSALVLAVMDRLRPDLLIFDEFQRFFEILPTQESQPADDDGAIDEPDLQGHAIVRALLGASGESDQRAAVLMLSATPYRMYARARDANEHHRELFRLVQFLFREHGVSECAALQRDFAKYRHALERDPVGSATVLEAKSTVERRLGKVMARTERSGLLGDARTSSAIVPAFVRLQQADLRVFGHLLASSATEHRSAVEAFWSSVPFPLQMMPKTDYAFRRRAGHVPIARGERVTRLHPHAIRQYDQQVWPHPRLRGLLACLPSSMLSPPWLPPSLPWWPVAGVFADACRHEPPSKTLVFSRFRAVPRALATLLTYEAERIAISSAVRDGKRRFDYNTRGGHKTAREQETAVSKSKIQRPLRPLPRPAFLPGDVLALAIASHGLLSLTDARDAVRARLKERLGVDETPRRRIAAWRWLTALEDPDTRVGLASALSAWRGDKALSTLEPGELPSGPSLQELEELTDIAICGPGPILVRAVHRVFGPAGELQSRLSRLCAALLDGFRPYLDAAEFHLLLGRDSARRDRRGAVRRACWDGNLESVLDEFLCAEQGLGSTIADGTSEDGALVALFDALSLRDTRLDVDRLPARTTPMRLRCHAAVAFGLRARADTQEDAPRADQLRKAFNSPFRPMVLATTSIGQEGLDFHRWARHVVHWDLPNNPVDLEQREGRLNRHGGLAVRQALAATVKISEMDPHRSPWHVISSLGAAREDCEGLVPWWHTEGAAIRRTLLVPSFSELEGRSEVLQEDLSLYRLAMGQPDQEALVRRLRRRLTGAPESEQHMREWLRQAAIDLRPRPSAKFGSAPNSDLDATMDDAREHDAR
jgi:hypothetical protein